jgi:hypothetical protein
MHLPMFWMGRGNGFRLADMPMDAEMLWGMALIVAGLLVAGYGLLPRKFDAHLETIGDNQVRLVNRSHLGLHLQSVLLSTEQQSLLHTKLDAIRQENKEFIDIGTQAASRVAQAFEKAVSDGVLTREELELLRPVNVSMGLMLENVSSRLMARGGPHHAAPDKDPAVRLRTIADAGELKIAFTTGILIGIGETAEERADSLLAIRELDDRYGGVFTVSSHDDHGVETQHCSRMCDDSFAPTDHRAGHGTPRPAPLGASPDPYPCSRRRCPDRRTGRSWDGLPVSSMRANPETCCSGRDGV